MKYIYSILAIIFSTSLLFYALNATYPEFSATLMSLLSSLITSFPSVFPLSNTYFSQLIFLAIFYSYLLSLIILLAQAIKGKLKKFMATYYGGTLTFCSVFTSIFFMKLLTSHFLENDLKLHELLPNLF